MVLSVSSSSDRPNAAAKLLNVLETLCSQDAPLSARSIVQRSELTKPSVYRILLDLESSGYARRHENGTYGPGPALLGLAATVTKNAPGDRTLELLHELQAKVAQTVHFAVRAGDHAVYLHKLGYDNQGIRIASGPGMKLVLHSTAIGKAILAQLPEPDVRAYALRCGLGARTGRTITDLGRLLEDLALVRRRGWALDDRENEEHVRCLGAVVTDAVGTPLGGISISTVAQLLDRESLQEYGPVLVETAARVSQSSR
jgi:IclR family acetate operon transcriptional repressor